MLVELGQLTDAKVLALKLMKNGSYQVECSDEGLMSDDICQSLEPVIQAVKITHRHPENLVKKHPTLTDLKGSLRKRGLIE